MAKVNFIRTRKLGFHRNNKRLWLTPRIIEDAGLKGHDVVYLKFIEDDGVPSLSISTIADTEAHKCHVAETARGGVLDLNTKQLTAHFADYDQVHIHLSASGIYISGRIHESRILEREESIKSRVLGSQPLRKGGLYAGLGLLCRSAHRGLKQAGINVKQRFGNEYAELPSEVNLGGNEIWEDAFDDAVFLQEDIFTMDMRLVPKLDIVVLGNPCPAFSKVNTNMKKSGQTDVFHPESGTIFQPTLNFLQASNPAIVVLENSTGFKDSLFDYIMSDVMKRFGYCQMDTTVTGREFGAFERRERLCRMWVSKGLGMPLMSKLLSYRRENELTVADIIEPMDLESDCWGERKCLIAKDKEAHNGHKHCLVSMEDTKLNVLGANYHKIQADSPHVPHPVKVGYSRIFTASEHCNIRKIDGRLKQEVVAVAEGHHPAKESTRSCASSAQKMLGNGVNPEAWESVFNWIGSWLNLSFGPRVEGDEAQEKAVYDANFEFQFDMDF